MTRLQRFRGYMARMNPTGDPAAAMKEGLYVHPPGRCVASELATRLELEPASTHLVLGGIGSGKTSELLRAAEQLQRSLPEAGDHVAYYDISQHHDLGAPTMRGILVALAGLDLGRHAGTSTSLSREQGQAIEAFHRHAAGKVDWVKEPSPSR